MDGPVVDPALAVDPPPPALVWVCGVVGGGRVAGVRMLTGGLSLANHAVTVESSGGARTTVVLRRWVWPVRVTTDVAHMRWNLSVAYGPETADAFTTHYVRSEPDPGKHLAWWDVRMVVDLLDHDEGWPFTPATLPRLEEHLRRALG